MKFTLHSCIRYEIKLIGITGRQEVDLISQVSQHTFENSPTIRNIEETKEKNIRIQSDYMITYASLMGLLKSVPCV